MCAGSRALVIPVPKLCCCTLNLSQVCGQEIVADYRLDNVKTGKIRLGVSALDFGLPSAQETGDEHSKPG